MNTPVNKSIYCYEIFFNFHFLPLLSFKCYQYSLWIINNKQVADQQSNSLLITNFMEQSHLENVTADQIKKFPACYGTKHLLLYSQWPNISSCSEVYEPKQHRHIIFTSDTF